MLFYSAVLSAMDKAVSIERRLTAMERFHRAGVRVTCFISPIFPGITDVKAIIRRVKNICNLIWLENLNLRGGFRTEIFDFIRREYPHLISLYHEIYREGRSDEWRVLDEEIRVFAAEEGLDYAVADDTMRRPFDAPPLIVNWFFHEQVKRTAKKR